MSVDDSSVLEQIASAVAAAQDAHDVFDEVVGRHLGLNRTDLRCLSVIHRGGSVIPSELARSARLSRPATTAALDRLVAAGYVRRRPDEADRRRVLVEPTARAIHAVRRIWQPLEEEGMAVLRRMSAEGLRAVLDYLYADAELQQRHADRVSTLRSRAR